MSHVDCEDGINDFSYCQGCVSSSMNMTRARG